MMIKLLGFSFLSGLLGMSLAMYLGLGVLGLVASYILGSMAATCVGVLVCISGQGRPVAQTSQSASDTYGYPAEGDQNSAVVVAFSPAA